MSVLVARALRRLGREQADHPGRRAGHLRARAGLRGRPRALRRLRHARREGRRRGEDDVPADARPKVFEKIEYMDSFPQLVGRDLLVQGQRASGARAQDEDPRRRQLGRRCMASTDCVLTPAACYPVYPSFAGTVGRRRAASSTCRTGCSATSRRPSRRACRRSACASSSASARPMSSFEWRDMWLERGLQI